MAITDLSQTPGFTSNPVTNPSEVEVPKPSTAQSIQNIGDVPPPTSSVQEAPPVREIVPGEVLPLPRSVATPSELTISSDIQNAADSITALAASQKEQEALVPSATEAPKYNSILGGIAPAAYNSLTGPTPPTQKTAHVNPRGYTSTLYQLTSGTGGTPVSVDQSARAVNAAQDSGSPIEIAKSYLGYDERNPQQSKALAEFFKKAGGVELNPATTAWCAAWANSVLGISGYGGTGKVNAQSFLDYGQPVEKPEIGDIVVFERGAPGSWQGHVGFVAGVNKDGTLQVLGGNQSSDDSGSRGVTVNIKTFSTDRVLGYRRPVPMEAQNGQS